MRLSVLERALTIFDLLVGGACAAMLAGAVFYAFFTFSHTATQQTYNSAAKAAAQTVVDDLERDCGSAIACFVPAQDVGNNPNGDGHEVAMYTRDAAGVGQFWSYCYRATGTTNCTAATAPGSVNLYGAYQWADLLQNGGAGPTSVGAIASNLLSMGAKTVLASALLNSTVNPLTATVFQAAGYTTIQDVTRQTGYTGVLAGNRVTIVTTIAQGLTRTIHIAAGARPTHVQQIIAQITPSPNAIVPIGSGTTLAFASPISPPDITGISESNYGNRSTIPPQIYTLSANSCSGTIALSPTGNFVPVGDGTGDATLDVAPVVQAEPSGVTCAATFTDNVGQQATFNITVGATYLPSVSVGASSYTSGATASFTATEQNYAGPSASGGFTASTSGVCGAPTLVSDGIVGGVYSARYTAVTSSNGTCDLSVLDVYGQTAGAATNVIQTQLVCSTDPLAGTTRARSPTSARPQYRPVRRTTFRSAIPILEPELRMRRTTTSGPTRSRRAARIRYRSALPIHLLAHLTLPTTTWVRRHRHRA